VQLLGASGQTPSGLPLVQPSAARVAYTITNVGDTTSAPAPVFVSYLAGGATRDTVPPIAPGVSVRREVALDYSSVSPFRFAGGDRDRVFLAVEAPRDSVNSMSFASTEYFRVAIPLLGLEATADSLRVRAGLPLAGEFRLVNHSQYAASPPVRIMGCLFDRFRGCTPEHWTAFGGWDVPSIPPQGSATFATSITVPVTATWQDEDLTYSMGVCSVPSGYTDPYLDLGTSDCGSGALSLLVRPDYEACTPPLLLPGVPYTFTGYNCGLRPATTLSYPGLAADATQQGRFHLVALDVAAGATYGFTRSGGTQPLRFYDADGFTQDDVDPAADRIRFAQGGRIYLVLWSPQPALTVTLEAL
jgi:hypothetical protein